MIQFSKSAATAAKVLTDLWQEQTVCSFATSPRPLLSQKQKTKAKLQNKEKKNPPPTDMLYKRKRT